MKKKLFAIVFCTLFLFSSIHVAAVDSASTVSPCFIFDDMIECY